MQMGCGGSSGREVDNVGLSYTLKTKPNTLGNVPDRGLNGGITGDFPMKL